MNQLAKLMYSVFVSDPNNLNPECDHIEADEEVPFYFHLGLSFQNNLTVTTSPPFQLQLLTIINQG